MVDAAGLEPATLTACLVRYFVGGIGLEPMTFWV